MTAVDKCGWAVIKGHQLRRQRNAKIHYLVCELKDFGVKKKFIGKKVSHKSRLFPTRKIYPSSNKNGNRTKKIFLPSLGFEPLRQ